MSIDKEEKEALRDLLYEASDLLDQIVQICDKDSYLRAYVPGNLWAQRYGFLGKGALDYLDEWLEKTDDEGNWLDEGEEW